MDFERDLPAIVDFLRSDGGILIIYWPLVRELNVPPVKSIGVIGTLLWKPVGDVDVNLAFNSSYFEYTSYTYYTPYLLT